MLVPIFSLKLNNKISARTVVVGKYDGLHPCLTAATLAGKVFIHNPHRKYSIAAPGGGVGRSAMDDNTSLDSNLSMLNINAVVTALAVGCLDLNNKSEILFVGTKTSLLAYDVNNNTDLFFKEV
jgi:Bardet-Biedl syndrome 2 protein